MSRVWRSCQRLGLPVKLHRQPQPAPPCHIMSNNSPERLSSAWRAAGSRPPRICRRGGLYFGACCSTPICLMFMFRPAFFAVPLASGARLVPMFSLQTERRAAEDAASRGLWPPPVRNEPPWLIVAVIMLSTGCARAENKETAASATHMRAWSGATGVTRHRLVPG